MAEEESGSLEGTQRFKIRPHFEKKFKTDVAEEIMKNIIQEELSEKEYTTLKVPQVMNDIGKRILERLNALHLDGYKYIVQVVIAERKGQPLRYLSRTYIDPDADDYTSVTVITRTVIAVAVVHAIYFY